MLLVGQYDSPFVRRVAITAMLYGLPFEHRPSSVWGDAERLAELNPLRRVPTLVLDDGTVLTDTWVILDELDQRVEPERSLLPAGAVERRECRRLTALASGVADKSVSLLYETLFRTAASAAWEARCRTQVLDTLARLELELGERPYAVGDALSHADVAIACALRFLREARPDVHGSVVAPRLESLAARCEALAAFRQVYLPITNRMPAPSAAAPAAPADDPAGEGVRRAGPPLELFILDKNDSSWSMRPWLLLVHHGIPFTEVSLVASDPATPARIRELSPGGTIPVLRLGDELVWESLAVIETLAELFPSLPIWPVEPRARRHARAIAAEMHAGFPELRRHCSMNLALRTTIDLEPARRRELERFERLVEAAHATGADGPFLFGSFSAADAMLAPVATRIVSYGLPVGPVTHAWIDAIFGLPAFQRWEQEAAAERAVRPPAHHVGAPLDGRLEDRIPDGPCYAVVFSSQLAEGAGDYPELAARMESLAGTMPGYLGHVGCRDATGFGITVSYWSSREAIAAFRAETEHVAAQHAGRARFYTSYEVRVARVERQVAFVREP